MTDLTGNFRRSAVLGALWQRRRRSLVWGATVLLLCNACDPQPLESPIRWKETGEIRKGNLVVAVEGFVQAPSSSDPSKQRTRPDVRARIQYLLPIPDGSERLVFNDLRGLLYVTDAAGSPPVVYLDVRQGVGYKKKLVGFAFHPQFAIKGKPGYGKFYTGFKAAPGSGVAAYHNYKDNTEARESVIREWTAADPAANAFRGTSREVLRIGQAPFSVHDIGTLAFNPSAQPGSPDYGMLYVSLGDDGGHNDLKMNGQDLTTPLGAVLRIDPLSGDEARGYGIPSDNPFVSTPGAAAEIWAYGLRHPQQFSWDIDGRMFIADIGQSSIEEVNLGVAGGNYGWPLREGTFATTLGVGLTEGAAVFERPPDPQPFIYPVAQYSHQAGNAIGGGFVYRGQDIPALRGYYLFSDIRRGRVFAIRTDHLTPGAPTEIEEVRLLFDGEERDLLDVAGYIPRKAIRVDLRLGIDHRGELYLLTKGDGWIRKLFPATSA